jgi:hypothetical protein
MKLITEFRSKMKKRINKKLVKRIAIPIVLILIFILGLYFIVLRMDEDSWIKNSKGIWTKHGNPAETPAEVIEQQQIIACVTDIYSQFKRNGMNFSSQCLGQCGDYSIDIVHTPRTAEDNLEENQCAEYITGTTSHFIEIDKDGKIVRII